MVTPIESIGIEISYSTASNTYVGNSSWTAVSGLREVTPPTGGKVDKKECTTQDGAATTKRKQYTRGLEEPSDWSFKQVYLASAYAELTGIRGVTKGWKIKFSDGSTYSCDGFIDECKVDSPMDSFMEAEYSVSVTGNEHFAASGSL